MMIQGVKDKIIAVVLKNPKTSEGGIVLPDAVEPPQKFGKVISVGKDVEEIKIGDIIVFANFGGQVILDGNQEFRVLLYNEIYGVVKE